MRPVSFTHDAEEIVLLDDLHEFDDDDFHIQTGNFPAVPLMEPDMASNIPEVLADLKSIDGFIAAAIADTNSGMTLGEIGGGPDFNIVLAAASITEVVKAKLRAMKALKLEGDAIEDMLMTLDNQYHLIRPIAARPSVFVYVALDRSRANLAVARFGVADAEAKITF